MNPVFEDDEIREKESAKQSKIAADMRLEKWKHVLATPQGQDVFWELVDGANVFGLSKHSSGSEMYFLEGQRSVGLNLLNSWIEASPETFYQTMKKKKGPKNV